MPDLINQNGALGIQKSPMPPVISDLPVIQFKDIPVYQPQISTNSPDNTFNSLFLKPVNSNDYDKPVFTGFDNSRIAAFKNSKAFDIAGFNPFAPDYLEQAKYDKLQSNVEAHANTMKALAFRTYDTFFNTLAQNVESAKALSSMDITNAWESDRNLKNLQREKDLSNLMPTFRGLEEKKWYSFIPFTSGSGDFWEEFTPQLGFTLGTMGEVVAENLIIDFLTGGIAAPVEAAKGAKSIYDSLKTLFSVKRGAEIIKNLTNGKALVSNLKTGLQVWNTVNAAASESAFESAHTYKETEDKLIEAFKEKYGTLPIGNQLNEIRKQAVQAGNTTFKGNMPILLASNWVQFKGIMMPALAEKEMLAASKVGLKVGEDNLITTYLKENAKNLKDVWKTGSFGQRLGSTILYAGRAMKGPLSEGWEEISQRGISSGAKKYAMDKSQGREDISSAVQYGIKDMFTADGMNEFIGGALGGAIFGGIGKTISRFAKADINEEGLKKANIIAKMGFISDNMKLRIETLKAEQLAKYLNTESLNTIFKDEGLRDLFINSKEVGEMSRMLKENDMFNFNKLYSQQINRFLYTGLKTGKLDLRLEQLKNFAKMDSSELESLADAPISDNLKTNVEELIDHITERATEFEKIYKSESQRFIPALLRSHDTVKSKIAAFKKIESKLKLKYDDLNTEFNDLFQEELQYLTKRSMLSNQIDIEELDNKYSEFQEQNKERIADFSSYLSAKEEANNAQIHFHATEEGRKHAIFAAANAVSDAKEFRKKLNSLKTDFNDLILNDFEKLLNNKNIADLISEKKKQIKAVSNLAEYKKESQNNQQQIYLLEELLNVHSPEEKSKIIYEYLQYNKINDSKKVDDSYDFSMRENSIVSRIEELVKLEDSHDFNLKIFNFMEDPTSFNKYSAEAINNFIEKLNQDTLKLKEEDSSEENDDEEETITPTVSQTPSPVSSQKPVTDVAQEIISRLKPKILADEQLTQDELSELLQASSINQEAANLYSRYIHQNTPPITPQSMVIYNGRLAVVEDVKKEDGFWVVRLEDDSDFVLFSEVIPVTSSSESVTKTSFIPGNDQQLADDDNYDLENINRAISAEIRTISQEFLDKNNEDVLISPSDPKRGYTRYRQQFLNYISRRNELNDYLFSIEFDKLDNYPKGSEQHDFISRNPNYTSIVIKVRDSKGNESFDENFLPDRNGKKLVYSLAGNNVDKTNLILKMQSAGLSSIPVSIDYISHGFFPKTASRSAATILKDVPETDYSFFIARTKAGTDFEYTNGFRLRNGGFYIQSNNSFIKLVPAKYHNTTVNGKKLNILGLLDLEISSQKTATEIAEFLSKLFYTDSKNGLSFITIPVNNKYKVFGRFKIQDKVVQINPKLVLKTLYDSRINVTGTEMIEMDVPFKMFYVENNKIESLEINYLDFLKENTYGNKALVTEDNKKILYPVNRFLVISEKYSDLENTIKSISSQDLSIPDQIEKLNEIHQRNISAIQAEIDELQDHLNYLQDFSKQKAVDELIEQEVSKDELDELQQELGTTSHEETKQQIYEEVIADFEENGATVDPAPKTLFQKIVQRIKQAIIALFAGITIFSGIGFSQGYTYEQLESFVYRGLVKNGFIEPHDEVIKVQTNTVKLNTSSDSAYKKSITFFQKIHQDKKGIWSYRNQWLNKDSFIYVAGVNNENYKQHKVTYHGVEGIAHHLIMLKSANDLTDFTGTPELLETSKLILENTPKDHYIPVFKRLGKDRVQVTYKKVEDVRLNKDELTPVRITQVNASDLDFNKSLKAPGFKYAKAVVIKSTNQPYNSLVYTNKDEYGRFNGGSVILLFKDTSNNLIVREFSGSINGVENEINDICKTFNIPKSAITVGVFDAGSYTAKTGAINNEVSPSRYSDFNPSGKAGSSLMIPQQQNNSAETLLNAIPLLLLLRRKRQNNESISFDELDAVQNYILELKSQIEKLNEEHAAQIKKLEDQLQNNNTVVQKQASVKIQPSQTQKDDSQAAQDTPVTDNISAVLEALKKLQTQNNGSKSIDDALDSLFRMKSNTEESTELISSPEIQFLIDRFGKERVVILKTIVNSDVWAKWTRAGITLYKDTISGTGYHEAWHEFSQLYLTKDEKIKLYEEARQKVSSLKNESFNEIEEYLANDFMKYVKSDGKRILDKTPEKKSIFKRILDFLREIFGYKIINLETVYKDLYDNKLKYYQKNKSTNNILFGRLNSRIVVNNSVIFDNRKSARYLNYISSLFGQFVQQNKISYSVLSSNPDVVKVIYKNALSFIKQKICDDLTPIILEESQNIAKGKPTAYSDLANDLPTLIENIDDIFIHYIKQSKLLTNIENDDLIEVSNNSDEDNPNEESATADSDKDEQKEIDNAGKQFDRSGNEVSVIDDASEETKMLFFNLSKVETDSNGKIVRDSNNNIVLKRNVYGLTEPVNLSQIFNNVAILLEGSFSYDEMKERLTDPSNQKKFPEIALLLERLPDNTKPLNYFQTIQLLKFFKDFSKVYIPIYTLISNTKKEKGKVIGLQCYLKPETKRTGDIIKKQWATNFAEISRNDGSILYDENNRPYINPGFNLNYDFSKQKDVDDFLNLLGISFSNITKESKEYQRLVANKSDNYFNLNVLQNTLRERLKQNQKINNPFVNLYNPYFNMDNVEFKSERSILNDFVNLESLYTNINPSMSFRTAEGTMIYGLSLNNWLTNSYYLLNNAKSYNDVTRNPLANHLNINNNPNVRNSIFLKTLFNLSTGEKRKLLNGDPVKFEIGNYNGLSFVVNDRENVKGKSTTKLNPREKLIMDLNALLGYGAVEIMRTESSSSAFFARLNSYDGKTTDRYLPFMTANLGGLISQNPSILKVFKGYFEDEVSNIINLYDCKLENYHPTAKQRAAWLTDKKPLTNPGRFSIFREILPPALMTNIENGLIANSNLSVSEKLEMIRKTVDKYGDEAAKNLAKELDTDSEILNGIAIDLDVTLKDISDHIKTNNNSQFSIKTLFRSFVLNDFILNTEFSKLISGNIAFYKAYHKRSKGDTSTGYRPSTDSFLTDYLKNTHHKTLANALNINLSYDLEKTKTISFKDDLRHSKYIQSQNNELSVIEKDLKAVNPNLSDSELQQLTKNWKKQMTVADGQGHCTLDFYRLFRLSVGNWSYEDEISYEKEVIDFKLRNKLYTDDTIKRRDLEFYKKFENISSYFPPIKMQHNGPANEPGVFAPILDKFSIAPLIPSVIKNTPLEQINLAFIKENIGYSKFESGTKKYGYSTANFYNDDFTINTDLSNHTYEVFTSNLKEQILTKSKMKDQAIWGTQMRKLFMANLFTKGMTEHPKFLDLLNNYINIVNDVIDDAKISLFKEFGIVERNNELSIVNAQRFVKSLQNQVDIRNMNDNIKNSIAYDETTGKVLFPLEILGNKAAIQDLISGILDKKLTKIKINGDMLIQIASSGFESNDFKYTNATEEDIKKYGTNGLRFYHLEYDADGKPVRTKAMQIKVALSKDFKNLLNLKHPDGNLIGTIDRLNLLLKDEDWISQNREKITIVGYRIPTQGINSMEVMEIAEFLPEKAGSIIILPAEIVIKAGSDYDIDKMVILRPSLNDHGQFISEKTIGREYAEFKKLRKEWSEISKLKENPSKIDAATKMMLSVFNQNNTIEEAIDAWYAEQESLIKNLSYTIRKHNERAKTNKLITIYKDVLTSPEMFTQLMTPNDNSLIKSEAERMDKIFDYKLGDFRDLSVLKWKSNFEKFKQLLAGKDDLGVYALSNTISQILQQSGMTTNKTFVIKKMNFEMSVVKTMHLYSPEQLEKLTNEDGTFDFSNKYSLNNILKQEYFSQLINATVDIAADPYYAGLGINDNTIGVVVYLLHEGLPFNQIINFINQPIIAKYCKERLKNPDPKQKNNIIKTLLHLPPNVKSKALFKTIDSIDTSIKEYFSEEMLVNNLTNNTVESDISKKYQQQVFAHFLKLSEQASIFTNLQNIFKFDTKKYMGPTSIQNNLDLRNSVENSNLFNSTAIRTVLTRSLISPFNNLDLMLDVYKSLFPVGFNDEIVKKASEIMSNTFLDQSAKVKLERVLYNDWIEFIVKNFAEIENVNIEEAGKNLTISNEGRESLSDRLIKLKKDYPSLKSFDLVMRMFPNLSAKNRSIKNIELYRGLDNTSNFQNILIEEYRYLRELSNHELEGTTLSLDQVAEIRNFFNDLSIMGFYQSGFNRSPISFVDIIPYEILTPIFKTALERYQEEIKTYPGINELYLDAFNSLFKLNNNYGENQNRELEAWRGKNYQIEKVAPSHFARIEKFKSGEPVHQFNYNRNEMVDKSNSYSDLAILANKEGIFTSKGIYAMRLNTQYHFGNPVTGSEIPNVPSVQNIETAVEAYNFWLDVPVQGTLEVFTRKSVENDPDYMYLFTDNAARTSGSTPYDVNSTYGRNYGPGNYPTSSQAVIRGLNNAYPITTMVDFNKTQWTDNRLAEFKSIIDMEINDIKRDISKFKGIKFSASNPFGEGRYSKMKTEAKECWNYLNRKLAEIGIDNLESRPKPFDNARRAWILNQIEDYDSQTNVRLRNGEKFLYMNDRGNYYSHADALAERFDVQLINPKNDRPVQFIDDHNLEIINELQESNFNKIIKMLQEKDLMYSVLESWEDSNLEPADWKDLNYENLIEIYKKLEEKGFDPNKEKIIFEDFSEFNQISLNDFMKFIKDFIIEINPRIFNKSQLLLFDENFNNKSRTQEFIIKKDEKSNWTLILEENGKIINKNTNAELDSVKDLKLINKLEVKEAAMNGRFKRFVYNNSQYAAIINFKNEFKIVSLTKSNMGGEVFKEEHLRNNVINSNPEILDLYKKFCK